MYCLARSTAVSRASASSRFSRLAESCRASPSICLISSSLASSAVRLATRSSSCCCCATSCSYFVAAAARPAARGRPSACSRAVQILLEPLDRRLPLGERATRGGRASARASAACCRSCARLALGLRRGARAPFPWRRGALPSCGVSASRSASLTRRSACSSARPTVSAAMRLRLATQTANTAPAATSVTSDADRGTRRSTARVTSFPVAGVRPPDESD